MKFLRKHLDPARHVPPGFKLQEEKAVFTVLFLSSVLWAVCSFGTRLQSSLRHCLRYNGEMMEDFYLVLGNALFVFPIAMVCMLALAVMHYAYHYSGSRSIYLMRRLPNRWELHRRCLTLPVLGAVGFTVLGIALLFAFFGIYMLIVPDKYINPGQFSMLVELWSVM